MFNNTINNDMEKSRFEYELDSNLNYYLSYDFVNFRDICLFSPNMFSEFKEKCMTKDNDITMIKDDVYHCATDKHGRKYFIDRMSGLIFYQEGKNFIVAKNLCTSKHYDVLDAAYLRKFLLSPSKKKKTLIIGGNGIPEITGVDYLGWKTSDIFTVPIQEYIVSSKKELEELIEHITSILSKSKFFRKLWFRGQRREYTINRSKDTINKLGFSKEFVQMPSLIPSAGRINNLNDYEKIRIQCMYWIMAFKIWLLSQSNSVVPEFKIDGSLYKKMIKSLEPQKMTSFLYNNPYDIEEYVFSQSKTPIWASILAAQQYGGYTSMLDITDNIDIALFFTQSYLNTETKKYELCEPNPDNVIYLIAETRGSSTIAISKDIFNYIPYDCQYTVPPRISNQCCGLLKGADMFDINNYGYRVLAKIKFFGSGIKTSKTVDEMFPGIEIDTLYKTYSYAEPKLTGLYG